MPITLIQHDHLGVCPCCGSQTERTSGLVETNGIPIAGYLVKWTVGDPTHGMRWLISLPDASGQQVCVDMAYSFEHTSFMLRDRGEYQWAPDEIADAGDMLDRADVVGTPLAERVFAIADEIWVSDRYVREFVALTGKRRERRSWPGFYAILSRWLRP
jgi:hypothetical protein